MTQVIRQKTKAGWVYFVSRRFARVDRKGRAAPMSFLSSLGIAFGVMTLIVIMAVMNGFQMGYIESIMEIHSYHVRALPKTLAAADTFLLAAKKSPVLRFLTPFYEAQALTVGKNSRQQAALIRFVPENIIETDSGFSKEIKMVSGDFDLSNNQAVIGSTLAYNLELRAGDSINLLALSGSSEVDLLSESRIFTVSGIFSCAYDDINGSFAFFSLDTGKKLLGKTIIPYYGIKLINSERDSDFFRSIPQSKDLELESWRSYNRTFFGALRIEKNLLMMIVFLIFIVVGVNIFNGMRRMVFERREEIAVLSALGAHPLRIQGIFILQGLLTGCFGAVPGLILGMLISLNMDFVFIVISKLNYWFQYFFTFIFNYGNLYYVTENPMFRFYAQIPARMFFNETALITLFGVLSALIASWIASSKILKLSVAEVLRYE